MNGSRSAEAASSLLSMRTPLARVELAASRLAREGLTPSARELARGISEAVAELDRRLDSTLQALLPPEPAEPGEDCRGVPGALLPRLAPVLEARGIALELADPPSGPVLGRPERLRHAAVALLRAGAAALGAGGWLRLALAEAESAYGLALELARPEGEAGALRVPAAALEDARAVAHAHAGTLETGPHGAPPLRLWLPRPERAAGAP